MKVRAIECFSGPSISMHVGEEREVSDSALLNDLLDAGYVEKVNKPTKKAVKASEGK